MSVYPGGLIVDTTPAARRVLDIRGRVEYEIRLQRMRDLHTDPSFAGLTWVVDHEQARAMTIDDMQWLDSQWRGEGAWL